MKVGVVKESLPGERRVSMVPGVVGALGKAGLEIIVQAGAGAEAGFPDAEYEEKGARIVPSREEVLRSEVVLLVRCLGANPEAGRADLGLLREGQTLIGFCDPLGAPESARVLAERGLTVFSMELIPRIARAQSMDALSSMATVAGYKAVLLAAGHLPRMFPLMMTAAGTIRPARVFVVGAGVAGLQAIASSRRLGAVVEAFDIRPEVKEQVQSMGAKFVELELTSEEASGEGGYARAMGEEFYRRQRELMGRVVENSDVVITTAAVPGKKAPVLVTSEMVSRMAPGSVVVDLAAERGGNCELTRADETVVEGGVTILGPTNLPATVPYHASQMYAKNVGNFLLHLVEKESLGAEPKGLDDPIAADTLVSRGGQVVNARVREMLGLDPETPAPAAAGTPSAQSGGGSA